MYHYPVAISPNGGYITEPPRGFPSLNAAIDFAADYFAQPAHRWVMVLTSERAASTPMGIVAGPLGGRMTLSTTTLYWPGGPATRADILDDNHVGLIVSKLDGTWEPPRPHGLKPYAIVRHDGTSVVVHGLTACAARTTHLGKYPRRGSSDIAGIVPLDRWTAGPTDH